MAAKLGCSDELADVLKDHQRGAGYQRQRRVAAEHGGDLRAVVLDLVKQMRKGPEAYALPASGGAGIAVLRRRTWWLRRKRW